MCSGKKRLKEYCQKLDLNAENHKVDFFLVPSYGKGFNFMMFASKSKFGSLLIRPFFSSFCSFRLTFVVCLCKEASGPCWLRLKQTDVGPC